MKKTLLTLVGLLILVFVIFSFLGRKSDYFLERKLWEINKDFTEYAKDPLSVPSLAFMQIADKYDRLAENHANSILKPFIRISSAKAHVFAKEYDKAREKLEVIISENKDQPTISSQALAEIGRTYALENNEEAVMATYQRMIDDFSLTSLGFSTPLYIAKTYANKGMLTKANAAYVEAIAHYSKIVKENKDTLIAINAQKMIATCYNAQQKWEESIAVFKNILLDSPPELMTIESVDSVIRAINTVSLVQLNSFDIPIDIYTTFIEKNPQHALNRYLQRMIDGFVDLKNKNVNLKKPQ